MANKPEIRRAKAEHIPDLAAHMRPADIQEAWASAHMTPERALTFSLDRSEDWSYSIILDGKVLGMFGVASVNMLSEQGVPWLLMTDGLLADWGTTFASRSKRFLKQALDKFPNLVNYVDVRNKDSIRWLKWMGFQFAPPAPYGPDNCLFHKFAISKEDIQCV